MKYNVFARPMFKRGGMSQGTGITSGLDTPTRNFQYGTGLAYGQQSFPDGFNKVEGDTSINMQGIPRLYNNNFTSEDPHQFRYPFPPEGYFNKMKPERDPPTIIPGVPGGGDPDMFYKKLIEGAVEEDIPSLISEKATKSEEDILLDQLGDTSLSKGEKALMLADIIGTPGGMEGKTKKALALMRVKLNQTDNLKKISLN